MKKVLIIIFGISCLFVTYNLIPETLGLDSDRSVVFENDRLKVSKLGAIDRMTALFTKDGAIYGFEDHYLYKSTDGGMSFEQLGVLPKYKPNFLTRISNFIARLKITRKIRRPSPPQVVTILDSGTIIVFYDHIYRSENNGKTFQAIPLPIQDFSTPFTNEIAVSPSGNIYLGEYSTKKRPHEVRILKGTNDGKDWSVAYTFSSGKIFHIHAIYWSELRKSLLIAAGDLTEEVNLFETSNEFETVELVGNGDQGWRIVSLSENDELLFWASDNDRTGSHIYTMKGNQRQQHDFIGKVSYDATKLMSNTLAISETLEPISRYVSSSNTPFELGVWLSNKGKVWTKALNIELINHDELLQTKKRPRLIMPTGDGSINNLLISPYNVNSPQSCQEPCTLMYKVEWKDR